MKIVYQRAVVHNPEGEFERALVVHINSIKRPEVEVVFRGVEKAFTEGGEFDYNLLLTNAAPGGTLHRVVQAKQEGYDAVMLGHPWDPILYEARQIVDIPVLGISETSMLVSCMLGRKFAILAGLNKQAEMFERMIKTYGLEDRVACAQGMGLDIARLIKGLSEPDDIISHFTARAKEAIDLGAEVIIPGSTILDLILSKNRISQIDDCLVLPSITTLVKITEAMVELRKAGVKVSRKGLYSSPNKEIINKCLDLYGLT